MGKKKKLILICALLLLLLFSSLAGAILYYYHHPSKIKPLIEQALSRATGTRCTIQELLYSVEGRTVGAKGIVLSPGDDGEGFHLHIPDLGAKVTLEGPFRHKTLVINTLRMDGLSLELSRTFSLPEIKGAGESPSLLSRTLRGLAALLLFRNVRLETLELGNGHLSGRLGEQVFDIKGLSAKVNEDRLLDISGSALVESPSEGMSLHAPFVRITTDQAISIADLQVKGMLELKEGRLETGAMDVENLTLSTTLTYIHDRKTLLFNALDADLKGATLKEVRGGDPSSLNLNLKADGLIQLPALKVRADRFQLTVEDMLDLRGSLKGDFIERPTIDLQGLEARLVPSKAVLMLPAHLKARLGSINLSGPLTVSGRVEGRREAERWTFTSALEARLTGNPFSLDTSGFRFNTRMTGEIRVTGEITDPTISMEIKAEGTTLSGTGILLAPSEANLSLTGRYPLFEVKALFLHVPRARIAAGKRAVPIEEITARARTGALDLKQRLLSLPHLEVESPLLKNAILSLELREDQILMGIRGEAMGIIAAGAALNLSPPSWTFKGTDTVRLKAGLNKAGGWTLEATLGLQDLSLRNADSSCMGEKIGLRVELKGTGHLQSPRLALAASVQVEGGELLYDRFYLDLARNPFLCTLKGEYDTARNLVEIEAFKTGLRNILSLAAKGKVGKTGLNRQVRLSVTMPDTPLPPVFRHLLLEPYKREKPILATLDVGGLVSADLEVAGDGTDWTLKGRSRWRRGNLAKADGAFSLQGIDLDLPLWYRFSFGADPSGDRIKKKNRNTHSAPAREGPLRGNLSIQSMNLPVIPAQALSLRLTATANGLSVARPTKVKMPGGEIEVGPIACRLSPRAAPSVATSLRFKALDLEPLLSGIWPRPVQGLAEGRIDPVHLEADEVRTRGEISVQAFGGEVLISNLAASGIFTPAPTFHVDAELKDLRMAELTKETSFGRIEGLLEGHVRNLEIAYGQPQRFDLLLETVERRGVPQKISVRAVDNIARIGGGQSPFMGMAGVLTTFFREFPYEKMGVRAFLENDVFRINGTIKEGDKEYIIKRGGFSGVDVVNQNPDNLISFKDMVKRIRRVTGSKSGPVVK